MQNEAVTWGCHHRDGARTPPRRRVRRGTHATKTIVVNTTVDAPDANPKDGMCKAKFAMLTKPGKSYCSLRAAIQTANFGPRGSYLIKLPTGSFHLTVLGKNEGKAAKGDLDVLQADVTLVGQGPAKTTATPPASTASSTSPHLQA